MVLHTLNALPDAAIVDDCLGLLKAGDALLLLGDAVYMALASADACERLRQAPATVYLLADDAAARGVTEQLLWSGVSIVDMGAFVTLTERFPRQQAWY